MSNYSDFFHSSVQSPYTSYKIEDKSFKERNSLVLELYSYISWVEKSIKHLDGIGNITKKLIQNDTSVDVTLDVYDAFKSYFKKEVKLLLNELFKTIIREPLDQNNIDRFEKLLNLIKEPFEEVKNYPLNKKLHVEELNGWFLSLVETLEGSVHKLLKFIKKVGYNLVLSSQEIAVIARTNPKKVSTNYDNRNDFYGDSNIGGKMPSSCVTAA
ncbi:hypothetical protein J1P26_15010 [Neobacillus sp. MM2021_6]|uniref:hypothetical protein n=1 Tax=Bacillaceae TaxID=186817 RepID=UPI0014077FC7|nr:MULTISPECIES: hypothetical protein [Bacillaceae]MBO0961009.1 hypothetical protein [Neobacillus sp. MM2021_6]NHC19079.1 hypothetical protein [Bacillus sp. MM2020_4]